MKDLNDHIQSALKKEINFQLPEDFSGRIINMIAAREKRERRWEVAGIITAAFLFIAALAVTLYFTDFKFSLGGLTFLSDHVGLISFGILFITLLHVIDKKVIHKQVG